MKFRPLLKPNGYIEVFHYYALKSRKVDVFIKQQDTYRKSSQDIASPNSPATVDIGWLSWVTMGNLGDYD